MPRDDLAAHLNEPVLAHARKDVPLLRPDMTIDQALDHIRNTGVGEKIIYFYVADERETLLGVVPTRRLLIHARQALIKNLMVPTVIAIPHTATLLDACELFVLYKYLAFPIVDHERRIRGVIDISFFAAEVFQMSEEESHDEVFEAIGLHVDQLRHASPATAFRHRFPWLLGTIASGTICAFLAGAFETTLAQALTVAFFLPLVLGLNESVAMQSMSLSLQALRGSKRNAAFLLRGMRRELATSLLLAAGAGLIAGSVSFVWRRSPEGSIVLAAAILGSVVVAGLIGFATPLVLRLGRRDPKIAAGPVALAVVDIFALLAYLTLAMWALT